MYYWRDSNRRAFLFKINLLFVKINYMLIDTHSHLNFSAYKEDREEVIKRSLDNGVWMINVGSKYETSRKAVEIAEKYEKGVYAAIGLHPMHSTAEIMKVKTDPEEGGFVSSGEEFNYENYKKLALSASERVVAIGEIGLDYYYRPKTKTKIAQFKEKQKKVFLEQMELAQELNLPVILHCRMAHKDLIEILNKNPGARGVVHCFTGNWEEAEKYIEMGFYLGLNGIIFKMDLDKVIENAPLDKILIETDCPYLTPPQEGNIKNEPIFIKYVVERIAKIRGTDFNEIGAATTKNTESLFGIDAS